MAVLTTVVSAASGTSELVVLTTGLNKASVTHESKCWGGLRSVASYIFTELEHMHVYILFNARQSFTRLINTARYLWRTILLYLCCAEGFAL